jgi:microcin C transport system substrate-binding protein
MLRNFRFPNPAARALAILIATSAFFTACKRSSTDPVLMAAGPPVADVAVEVESGGELDPIASPDAKRGGSYVAWAGPYPKSLNMFLDYNTFSKEVCELLFLPLVDLHSTKDEPVGILAEYWEISPDNTIYTFRIHPAAKWSDGRPVTAEDVQYFYDVIMDPKNLTSLFRVAISRFARPELVDERTVRMKAQEPHWSNFSTASDFVALPKHILQGKDFNAINFEFPVVNGPYALDEVKTNRSIRLKRRGDWWGRARKYNQGKYNFDYITYRSMSDQNKVFEAVKKGDIDAFPIYTARIWAEQTDIPQVQKNWIVRQSIFNEVPLSFQGFSLNLRRPIFQDLLVRQALAHLVNRELMNEKLMFNAYFLLNSYYPDLHEGHRNPNAPMYEYNPEKARALLKELDGRLIRAEL